MVQLLKLSTPNNKGYILVNPDEIASVSEHVNFDGLANSKSLQEGKWLVSTDAKPFDFYSVIRLKDGSRVNTGTIISELSDMVSHGINECSSSGIYYVPFEADSEQSTVFKSVDDTLNFIYQLFGIRFEDKEVEEKDYVLTDSLYNALNLAYSRSTEMFKNRLTEEGRSLTIGVNLDLRKEVDGNEFRTIWDKARGAKSTVHSNGSLPVRGVFSLNDLFWTRIQRSVPLHDSFISNYKTSSVSTSGLFNYVTVIFPSSKYRPQLMFVDHFMKIFRSLFDTFRSRVSSMAILREVILILFEELYTEKFDDEVKEKVDVIVTNDLYKAVDLVCGESDNADYFFDAVRDNLNEVDNLFEDAKYDLSKVDGLFQGEVDDSDYWSIIFNDWKGSCGNASSHDVNPDSSD